MQNFCDGIKIKNDTLLHNDLKKDAINEFGINIEHQTLYGSNFRNM
jgi:hypothetical protein